MEWTARHAAIEVGRSPSRDRPPETAVNAAPSSVAQDMTSRITSVPCRMAPSTIACTSDAEQFSRWE
jgi:hypothetical protein